MSDRRRLHFADTNAVAAEVERLRAGYTHAGNWSLPQTCWHLGKAIRFSMRPGPWDPVHPGPTRWLLPVILIMRKIPSGVHAPERVTPAIDVPDAAIDEFLTALEELKNYKGEFAPHPKFGPIKRGNFRKLHFIHCAHHFGFLTPTTGQQV